MASPRARKAPPSAEGVEAISATASHLLRLRVAAALAVESPLGADDIASSIDEPLHKVRRHLNALVAAGIVSVAAEESRRGALKRYFALETLIWLEPEDEAFLDHRERRQFALVTIRMIFDEASRAAANPRLTERGDRMVANSPGRVDERGWDELARLHQETLEKVEEILAESRTRLGSGEKTAIGVISSQILLEAPQHGPSLSLSDTQTD